jgi:cell division septation protein DedD
MATKKTLGVGDGTGMGEQSAAWLAEQAKLAAAKKPVAKAVRTCRFGEGAYGSPAESKRCGKPIFELDKHPGHQLCIKHIPVWAVESKRRAAAKPATAKRDATPKSAGTSKPATPKTRKPVAKAGPVTKTPKSVPMHAPIARVVRNTQPGAMISQLVALDPTDGPNDK